MKSPAGAWLFDASVNLGRFDLQHLSKLGDYLKTGIADPLLQLAQVGPHL
jgi:hypothetical protein